MQRTPEEQQKLYETVKGDAALAHIFRWWFPPSPTCVTVRGSLATSAGFSDFGDMHPYAVRNQPSRHWGWGLSMERAIAEARKVSGTSRFCVGSFVTAIAQRKRWRNSLWPIPGPEALQQIIGVNRSKIRSS